MYYLAIDIGASSGRHIIGNLKDGKLQLQEIYRFPNGTTEKDGKLVWDTELLFSHVIKGLKECKNRGIIPYSVGIDTWGVDYALLDQNDQLIGDVYAYRDLRTKKSSELTHEQVAFSEIYKSTGIQFNLFNTVYQLYDDKLSGKLDNAKCMLTVPDYLHYLLSGVKVNEYTEASTTALINAQTRDWDFELIEKLGFPKCIFNKIAMPGTVLCGFTQKVKELVGFDSLVVIPASHDTASAVMAVPASDDNPLYISSGTWSLLGTELKNPITDQKALEFNMTNEGGYANTIRFLKNISGMWAIQNLKKEFNDQYSFSEIASLAQKESEFAYEIDINGDRFLSPKSMSEEIKSCAKEMGKPIPQTIGQLANVVYYSLAQLYAKTIEKLQTITGIEYKVLNVVGGGSQNVYLNALTKTATKKVVMVGPTEGTAAGNILAQAISSGEIKDIKQGRKIISDSFGISEVE